MTSMDLLSDLYGLLLDPHMYLKASFPNGLNRDTFMYMKAMPITPHLRGYQTMRMTAHGYA